MTWYALAIFPPTFYQMMMHLKCENFFMTTRSRPTLPLIRWNASLTTQCAIWRTWGRIVGYSRHKCVHASATIAAGHSTCAEIVLLISELTCIAAAADECVCVCVSGGREGGVRGRGGVGGGGAWWAKKYSTCGSDIEVIYECIR